MQGVEPLRDRLAVTTQDTGDIPDATSLKFSGFDRGIAAVVSFREALVKGAHLVFGLGVIGEHAYSSNFSTRCQPLR